MNATLPAGTVTFLFTDIEGSTKLLEQLGADRYGQLLSDQRAILRAAFAAYGGTEIDTQGDAFFISFPRASEAVNAVVQIQRALQDHVWPECVDVRVRMGLHTGEPWLIEEGYVGMDVHRAARIAHVGHGGQVLLSETTTSLVLDGLPEGVELLDLGRHRLKDMRRPEHIRQLVIAGLPGEFPLLTSLEQVAPSGVTGEQGEIRAPRKVGKLPYQGLAAFREDDAAFFFGRGAFTARLAETVQEQELAAVIVGPSGSGKSSTVFAGLLPQLRERGGWLILQLRPGREPFHALAGALITLLEEDLSRTDRLVETQKLARALRTGELSLIQVVELVVESHPGFSRLLLVIDQFEELYTLCSDPEIRNAFHDELLTAVEAGSQGRQSVFSLLLTLRADFMGQALGYRPFADALQGGSILLGPMNREELKTAIEKPAELQGAAFETGLVDRLLDDVGQEPGNLPLLEFALTLLWDRMEQGWMTHAAYESIGRVEGALARYADEVYEKLAPAEQEEIRRVIVQLVQPGEGTEDTRRVASRADIGVGNWDLIQHLADKRLVVTSLDENGRETVEVVHEALIRGWGRLRVWMNADRDFRRWQEGLRVALRIWEESDGDEGALLRGAPLAQAEEWLESSNGYIGETEKNFIQASLAFREQRQWERDRRRQLTIVGLAAGLVMALLLSVLAFSERNAAEKNAALAAQNAATAEMEAQARSTQQMLAEAEAEARATQQYIAEVEARARATQQAIAETERFRAENETKLALSRNLALDATRNLVGDLQLSLLLALQAVRQTYPVDGQVLPDALTALHQAVQANARLLLTIPARGTRMPFISFHPDGTHLIVYYFREGADPKDFPVDTQTAVYDGFTGELLHELPEGMVADHWPDSGHVAMVDLPDERTLELTIWDSADGTPALQTRLEIPFETTHDDIVAMTLSPDLRQLALSVDFGHTFVWEVETGELQADIFDENFTLWAENTGVRKIIGGEEFFNTTLTSYVVFTPDGSQLITKHHSGNPYTGALLNIWELANPDKEPERWALSVNSDLIVSPDSKSLVETWNNMITLYDMAREEDLLVLFGLTEAAVGVPTFSTDGSRLATAGEDGIVWIWDMQASRVSGGEALHLSLPVGGPAIHHMSLSPDGSRLATASEDGSVRIWDIQQPGGIEWLNLAGGEGPGAGKTMSIAVSPDGTRLAVADASPAPKIWDTETGELLFSLEGHTGPVEDLAYSPDGTLIATCSDAGPLMIWAAETGKAIAELDDYNDGNCSLAFHPGGTSLALGIVRNNAGWFQVLDLPELDRGVSELTALSHPLELFGVAVGDPLQIAVSPDGSRVALTYGGQRTTSARIRETDFRVFDLTRGGVQDLNYETPDLSYISVVFSPQGNYLASTLSNGRIEIWDAQEEALLRTLSGHKGPVNQAAFSPDDQWLATAGADGTTRIWNPETGLEIMALFGPVDGVTDVAFSPDGDKLYTAGQDGIVRVYLMDLKELLELAESRVTRTLTPDECRTYLQGDECPLAQ